MGCSSQPPVKQNEPTPVQQNQMQQQNQQNQQYQQVQIDFDSMYAMVQKMDDELTQDNQNMQQMMNMMKAQYALNGQKMSQLEKQQMNMMKNTLIGQMQTNKNGFNQRIDILISQYKNYYSQPWLTADQEKKVNNIIQNLENQKQKNNQFYQNLQSEMESLGA